MTDITVKVETDPEIPGCAVVTLSGAVTGANSEPFQREVQRALPPDAILFAFQLAQISYLSSAAFSFLVDLAATAERRGGVTVLVDIQPKVRVVIDNLGIGRFFRRETGLDAARQFLREHAEKLSRSPRVVVLEGPHEGVEYPILGTEIRIGGDPRSTIQLRYPGAEHRHAEIYRTGEQCFVRDLGSIAGVYIGERKVSDEALRAGDVVSIGILKLLYLPAGAATGLYYKRR